MPLQQRRKPISPKAPLVLLWSILLLSTRDINKINSRPPLLRSSTATQAQQTARRCAPEHIRGNTFVYVPIMFSQHCSAHSRERFCSYTHRKYTAPRSAHNSLITTARAARAYPIGILFTTPLGTRPCIIVCWLVCLIDIQRDDGYCRGTILFSRSKYEGCICA